MSAEVSKFARYQAQCWECLWWAPERETDEQADLDADEHDDEHHPTT